MLRQDFFDVALIEIRNVAAATSAWSGLNFVITVTGIGRQVGQAATLRRA